mmetsp:Transcript_25774/g.61251  ORF Transcript_25774/g.61251 Transcript_25774/m.61251 type:complete len:209 (-) Transcript_25774:138-764(-)
MRKDLRRRLLYCSRKKPLRTARCFLQLSGSSAGGLPPSRAKSLRSRRKNRSHISTGTSASSALRSSRFTTSSPEASSSSSRPSACRRNFSRARSAGRGRPASHSASRTDEAGVSTSASEALTSTSVASSARSQPPRTPTVSRRSPPTNRIFPGGPADKASRVAAASGIRFSSASTARIGVSHALARSTEVRRRRPQLVSLNTAGQITC